MTEDEVKAALSEKMTDPEKIREVFESLSYAKKQEINSRAIAKRDSDVMWPLREAARLQLGIYSTTGVLDEINKVAPVYAHVSREDKTQIAFTPDKVSGDADRQIRSNIGRLLSRVYPQINETTLRNLVEQHQAEANPNIVFLEGMDIPRAYLNPDSPKSCMRAESEEAGKAWTIENVPALAYAADGIKLAVMLKPDGKGIAARCLVVELGGKKWRIRSSYGSPVLGRWLIANGYENTGGWEGVVFNTVPHPGGLKNQYIMPYLDCNEGITTSQHCSVALVDGKITGVTRELRPMLTSVGASIALPGTSGYVSLANPFDSAAMQKTCAITGEKFKPWVDKPVKVFHEGSLKETCIRLLGEGYVRTSSEVYAKPEDTVVIAGCDYPNDVGILADYGYVRRSSRYYETQPWAYRRQLSELTSGEYVEKEDAVLFITQEEGVAVKQVRHKSEVPKGSTQLATVKGQKVFAEKGVEILRTDSKAKVHSLTHDIVTLWDGTVCYSRGVKSTRFYCEGVYYRGQLTEELREKASAQVLNRKLGGEGPWTIKKLAETLSKTLDTDSLYVPNYPSLTNLFPDSRWGYFDRLDWAERATISQLRKMVEVCTRRIDRKLACAWLDKKIAEMEAVEAPHYLRDAVPAAIPAPEIEILQPETV